MFAESFCLSNSTLFDKNAKKMLYKFNETARQGSTFWRENSAFSDLLRNVALVCGLCKLKLMRNNANRYIQR